MIRLTDRIRPLAVLTAGSDRDEALAALDAAGAGYAVVDHSLPGHRASGHAESGYAETGRPAPGRPRPGSGARCSGAFSRALLAGLPAGSPVGACADRAPVSPVLHVDRPSDLDDLTVGEAEALALLASDGTEGLVIVQGGRPVGFVPWLDLAEALPFPADEQERPGGGIPMTPARCYVCRRCDPPVRRLPRAGRERPVCPVDLRHGPMEREATWC
ncbi:hypothetical protein ACF068_29235 [Streptomyces sp. NPDC016309]|uniref:hypothetical protein n=1 Tax=Streptomyces sp. NPDC016309 TaxID=3364965 RepID=UPI00370143F0